jgi:uncharacterized protein YjiS (DUF1127 family)
MSCGSTNCISTHETSAPSFPDLAWVWRAPLAWLGRVFLAAWRRRQYADLLDLDDRLLADIGISRQQAVEAGLKSSWMNVLMTRYVDR